MKVIYCRLHFKNDFPIPVIGGLISGICKTGVKPTAFRFLREVNRNHTGRFGTVYSDGYL